jgi:N utilization substance protein B
MGTRRKGRILAFQCLYSYAVSEQRSSADLQELLSFPWVDEDRRANLTDESQDFARLITLGTIEKLGDVDEAIKRQLEHWDFSRLNKVDLALLRISVYSLLYQTEIPASVTIDEAVDIAKEFGTDDSYRFINGVLDGVRKQSHH